MLRIMWHLALRISCGDKRSLCSPGWTQQWRQGQLRARRKMRDVGLRVSMVKPTGAPGGPAKPAEGPVMPVTLRSPQPYPLNS